MTLDELFSQLSVLRNISFDVVENHGFHNLRILNPVLNCENSTVYYISISRQQKKGEFDCDPHAILNAMTILGLGLGGEGYHSLKPNLYKNANLRPKH